MDNGGISAVETPHQHTRLITKSPLSRRAKQRKEKKSLKRPWLSAWINGSFGRTLVCLIHHPKLIMPRMAVNDSYLRLGLTSLIHKNPFARPDEKWIWGFDEGRRKGEREWMSIEWVKHDDMMEKKRKEKQKKTKNFHWTRMCLSLRLGPIDVNWKQSLVDGARESLFVVELYFFFVFVRLAKVSENISMVITSAGASTTL